MSWDAWLTDDRGHTEGDWNFTHNTSCMIYAVLKDALGELPPDPEESGTTVRWWEHLNGMSGPEGAAYLHAIITGLEADPDRFRAMNPENGWGNYDDLVKVLRDMRDRVPEWPTTWSASG